jgi:hypothetical protein
MLPGRSSCGWCTWGQGGSEDTRRRVSREELPESDAAERVLDRFTGAGLISRDIDTVEINCYYLLLIDCPKCLRGHMHPRTPRAPTAHPG